LFLGFLVLSGAVGGFTAVERVRYHRALEAFAFCAAGADPSCAATALETLRSVDPENVRTELAEAQMRALQGEADVASSMLTRVLHVPAPAPARKPRPTVGGIIVLGVANTASPAVADVEPQALGKLSSEARGDALLLAGDIAALAGDATRADARWTEAAGVVDDALIAPRRARLASKKDDNDAQLSADLSGLRDEFFKLFDQARSGSDGASYAATALRTRVQSVSPPLAQQKLRLSIDAADRCAKMVRARGLSQNVPTLGGWRRPDPPIAPSETEMIRNPWMRGNYDRQMEQYRRNLARWDEQESDKARARGYVESEIDKSAGDIITEAESLLKGGLALAAASTPR
jgi:hypothetical protein